MNTKQNFNLSLNTQLSTISRSIDEDLFALGGKNVLKIYALKEDDTLEQKKILKVSNTNNRAGTTDIVWNPKENNILASTTLFNSQIFLWDIKQTNSSSLSMRLGSHELLINRISWNPKRPQLLASCSHDRFLKIWNKNNAVSRNNEDPKLPRPEMSIELKEKIRDCQFSPKDENYLLTSCVNGSINLWDLRKFQYPVKTFLKHSDDVLTIDWHPMQRNIFCSGGMDKNIYIWNINQDNPFMGYRTSNGTSRMKWFAANPQYIISSYQINNVYTSMWNINVQDIPEYKFTGHKDVVTGFCWDTSNTRLITCAKNGTVLVKKFSDGLRFFDNISTCIVKFSDGEELISYHDVKPRKKSFNDCDISKLVKCTDNIESYQPITGIFETFNFEQKELGLLTNPVDGPVKIKLNKTMSLNLSEQLQEIYRYDRDEIQQVFDGYCFILDCEKNFKGDKLHLTNEMTYTEKLQIAIDYNLNYAKNQVKNYNHIHMWKTLHFLSLQDSFKNINVLDYNNYTNNSNIITEGGSLFIEIIRQNILYMIEHLITNHSDIVLATIISFLFHPLLGRDDRIRQRLISLEEDCREYLLELQLYITAAKLKKFGFEETKKSQENPILFFSCINCGGSYDGTKIGECSSCKKKVVCFVCSKQVIGLNSWCSGCGHGGHPEHIKNWFSKNNMCPSGCGHRCKE